MKKALPPPENWQDFETLCKKLFGEIWNCPHTIKKNGRLGQPQAGVDVYGKPKGEVQYWGIQCKGKDCYEDKKLTEKEIDEEIQKALTFEPKLKTFIFATTASKDVHIEKYVRQRDIDSCQKGDFEIVLYCWQDLVDLIQENRDTFNWYVNNIQFKEQFDVDVSIVTENENNLVVPTFLKTIKKYEVSSDWVSPILQPQLVGMPYSPLFGSNEVNKAWCKFIVTIKNSGSKVLEDWKMRIQFPESVSAVDDDFTNDIFLIKESLQYRTTWADKDEKSILYRPLNNAPLIQKDRKLFNCYCKPHHETTSLKMSWHLLARDFDRVGETDFVVKPVFIEKVQNMRVINVQHERVETEVSDYKEKKDNRR